MWWTLPGEGVRQALHSPVQALVSMALGVLAVSVECAWPGRYVAGATGAALCVLGLAALSAFPLTAPGTLLLLLSAGAMALHARWRLRWLPLGASVLLLIAGLRMLTTPSIGTGAAVALAVPVSLTVGLLLNIARRSRTAKRQLINTGSTFPLPSPHNRRIRSEIWLGGDS